MKSFEVFYLFLEPFLPSLYVQVRKRLRNLINTSRNNLKILDVGGRKSPYTIGMPIDVTISELPRKSEIQKKLKLGINDSIKHELLTKRSNVSNIIIEDMVTSTIPSDTFDGVLAIEVLEHVEKDVEFLRQVNRVLKPGGFFLMTTPNGDHIPNTNPDHKRHYSKQELSNKLLEVFTNLIELDYIVADTIDYKRGLYSWSIRRPFQTIKSMISNIINRIQSENRSLLISPEKTCNLVAITQKSK